MSTLSQRQQQACEIALTGENVFITGSAGVGKSFIMKRIIDSLQKQNKVVGVTASTGIAAIQIGGITVFKYFRLAPKMLEEKETPIRKEWQTTDVLIIDEISMISQSLFGYLDKQGRKSRNINKPFGGIQLIVVGDFCQLPPVAKGTKCDYVFELPLWGETFKKTVRLVDVYRQNDVQFITLLENMRLSKLTEQDKQVLKELERKLPPSKILPTKLYCKKRDVEADNMSHLAKLRTEKHVYDYSIGATSRELKRRETKYLNDNVQQFIPVVPKVHLAINAQVMLVVNLSNSLVNGSRGIVCGFTENGKLPIVQFIHHRVIIRPYKRAVKASATLTVEFTFIPLQLAWAITIHKSQGQSINKLEIYCKDIFQVGQAYTALSRGTSLNSVQLIGFEESHVKTDPRVLEYYNGIQ